MEMVSDSEMLANVYINLKKMNEKINKQVNFRICLIYVIQYPTDIPNTHAKNQPSHSNKSYFES